MLLALSGAVMGNPISLVITSGPGSNQDTLARIVAPMLSKELGREVVVLVTPGANGLVGMQKFALMPADGSALLMGTMAVPYVAKTGVNPCFDPIKDLEPLHGLTQSRSQVLVRSDSPARNMREFVAWSKLSDGLFGGTAVPATTLFIDDLGRALKVKLIPTGYKQTSQIGLDLAAGRLDFTVSVVGNAAMQPHIDSGRIRAIGFTDNLSSEGFHNLNMVVWSALMVNAATPPEDKARLTAAATKVAKSQAFKDALATRIEGGFVYDVPAAEVKKRIAHEFSIIPVN